MDSNSILLQSEARQPPRKLYKRRWLILFLYIVYAALNAFQWFQYSIINNVVMKFYDVSAVAVDYTSIIYMALYMPMVIPASYYMEKKGLRNIVLIGALGTALGTIIKVFSLAPDRIWVVYLGQTILSAMQVFILALPPRIASVWFGPKEVSLACALGIFGTLLGQAACFLIHPMVIKNHEIAEDIGTDLQRLIYVISGIGAVIAVAVLIYFPDAPPTPPSDVRVQPKKTAFSKELKCLFADKGFIYLAFAYGINVGALLGIFTLFNQIILSYVPNFEEDAGRMALIGLIIGMVGSVFTGYILDKTHKYSEASLTLYFSIIVSVITFMFALESRSKVFIYIAGILMTFILNPYIPVGLEVAIELTYPQSENTSVGILVSMTQTMGVIFTLLLGWLFRVLGCFWALATMVLILFLGALCARKVPNVLNRQKAFNQRTLSNKIQP